MPTNNQHHIIAGNLYDKYHTKNPIANIFMNNFLKSYDNLIQHCSNMKNILEVGCGEGHLANHTKNINHGFYIEAVDISDEIIEVGHMMYPDIKFTTASAYELPYNDKSKDLVVACELLEHLENPTAAINEIKRVTRQYVLISVPREPFWSICNICRGKYLKRLGSTPPHLQKWTKKQIISLINKNFEIILIKTPFPWTMVLCKATN